MTATAPASGIDGEVAEVVLIQPRISVTVVAAFGANPTQPHTSQSPAVSEMLVTLAGVPLVSETAEPNATVDSITSPTEPAAALLFVFVPTMSGRVSVGVVSVLLVSVCVAAKRCDKGETIFGALNNWPNYYGANVALYAVR